MRNSEPDLIAWLSGQSYTVQVDSPSGTNRRPVCRQRRLELLDQPPGLYPQEELVRWHSRLPSLIIDEIPELNHYTIMLDPSGAARVAASVCTLS
jgi:hypothetical protein